MNKLIIIYSEVDISFHFFIDILSYFKFNLVEMIRNHKPIMKANKIKLTGIEESLVHKPFINLETLQAIVLCKNISLCIVQERKYYEIQNGGGGSAAAVTVSIGSAVGQGRRAPCALCRKACTQHTAQRALPHE